MIETVENYNFEACTSTVNDCTVGLAGKTPKCCEFDSLTGQSSV